ncbi:hypothetical protein B0A48_03092 [Cryoendolithus antarcticus]|uniref:ARID domain-containing protein n=1 Tax=Cryoendolithus antarcticus TaxID=1507870 RepID=A0A1V8TM51_9PEZI|nr:hypothetical protein B0A48_03092 [Cryoendolithus antarcticus]
MNNSIYSALPNTNHYDLGGNGSSPFQPQLQNGNQNLTPAFSNQTFQTAPTIPQKRDHNGMPSGSPAPGQQSQQFSNAPTPYAHLQQPGSAQATPSPTMQNQQFRQPSQQPRMQNASPSPFPSQQPTGYGTQMSPAPRQNNGQPGNVQPNGAMANFNPQYGMGQNAQMQQGMQNQMNAQMQQRQYQLRLLQQQAALRQQNGGIVPPRTAGGQPGGMYNATAAMQQGGQQMPNGQGAGPVQNAAMMQAQAKRKQFLQQCQSNSMQQGRQFNPNPMIGQKVVDLYQLFQVVVQMGGSTQVERTGQWQTAGAKLGFMGPGYENAGEQLKMLYLNSVLGYEQMWHRARQNQKMEQARQQAHQMAGYGPTAQTSPTKTMQPPPQQAQMNQMNQYSQAQQAQLVQQMQQNQALQQATPTQSNASLPQNGVSTPQQTMGGLGTIHHRRSGSMRKGDGPPPAFPGSTLPSPGQKVQRSPSIKQEVVGAVMKSEEPQSSNYEPLTKTVDSDGGLDVAVLNELGTHIQRAMPQMPSVDEMGVIDTRAIALSLASGIHAEVRYALDALAIVSMDQRIMFDLEKCDDLTDIIMDCAEDQLDLLSDEAVEVSDAIDLPSYESILRDSKIEADTLQDVPAFGTQAYELERAADKLVAITTILRNFSFYEHNHRLLTTPSLINWLSNTIRLIGTRHMLLRTHLNTQDFYKDMIIFLSNITQSLELPSRDDALHLLHFLLAFAPQPSPSLTTDSETPNGNSMNLRFPPFVPAVHRYLPPALDCLAKLLARQEPNRSLYRSLFQPTSTSPSSSTPPLDLLTRAFALAISVLPDRSKAPPGNTTQLRIVEARKAYLTQGMLAADILSSLAPANDAQLARAWLESEDAWAGSLVSLASLLSVEPPPRGAPGKGGMVQQQQQWDVDSFRLIATRALTMVRRLAERAGRTGTLGNGYIDQEDGENGIEDTKSRNWDGIPQGHAVIGALMLPNCDKVSLGLLCGLHEMAMRE